MQDELSALFHEELRDLLESLERGLLDLKGQPEDMALVNQVFRDLHTIKGNGAMFGYADLAAFIHEFESVFDRIRAGALAVNGDIIRLALAARDEIPGLVEGTPDPDGQREAILAALAALMAGDPVTFADDSAADADPAPLGRGDGPIRLWFRLVGPALGLGARPDNLLDELRQLGATDIEVDLTELPDLAELDPDSLMLNWWLMLPAHVTDAQIEDVFMFVDAEWRIERLDAADFEDIPLAEIDLTADSAASDEPAAPEIPAPDMAAPVASVPAAAVAPMLREDRPDSTTPNATIRVSAERLDALMDSVGELVIVEARLTELARQSRDPALMATAEQITRLAAGLRDSTMTMRMVPMRSLVGRFRRLVIGLSDKLEKPLNFSVLGEETELDKTVIEKLADPLVHILRNAIDHGMETPEDREAAGKPREGLVELSAEHAGAEVLIRVRDDGRGMDQDKIRAKAIASGLITADAQLTEAQIFALVFEPGLSTAASVTELSGRGVGMDVVRRTIESLRGSIDITSKLGEGTTVTLRLPLTLAIIEGLLIEVAGEKYTLPMSSVHEIVALPAEKAQSNRGGDFLDIRGRFVPFLRLRHLFECAGAPPEEQNVVIVMAGETRVGIVVDHIVGTNQTVIKQMSKLHAGVRAVSGATILGDGSVALILDVGHLVGMGRVTVDPATLTPREAAA